MLTKGGNEDDQIGKDVGKTMKDMESDINEKLNKRKKDQMKIKEDLLGLEDNIKAMNQREQMYLEIKSERQRFLTNRYMQQSPEDVEQMVKALYEHHNNIIFAAEYTSKDQNFVGEGLQYKLRESDKNLSIL